MKFVILLAIVCLAFVGVTFAESVPLPDSEPEGDLLLILVNVNLFKVCGGA